MEKGTRTQGHACHEKLDRPSILTDFIQTDMLDFSLVYCKFQSSVEGSQGTVDLTLRKK